MEAQSAAIASRCNHLQDAMLGRMVRSFRAANGIRKGLVMRDIETATLTITNNASGCVITRISGFFLYQDWHVHDHTAFDDEDLDIAYSAYFLVDGAEPNMLLRGAQIFLEFTAAGALRRTGIIEGVPSHPNQNRQYSLEPSDTYPAVLKDITLDPRK
jgi:hypothetical protein